MTVREEGRIRVFHNKVLKVTFGHDKERKGQGGTENCISGDSYGVFTLSCYVHWFIWKDVIKMDIKAIRM